MTTVRVFVYGTLVEPATVREVLDSFVFVGPATLHGLHAVSGTYPTLAPGGEVAGRLLRTDDIDALDEYERVADELYVRLSLPLRPADGDATGAETAGVSDTADAETAGSPDTTDSGTAGSPDTTDSEAAGPSDTTGSETTDSSDTTPAETDPTADTPGSVAVYVGDPERLDAPADWPGEGSFPARVRTYLTRHSVFVQRR